jgi:hypothetical protein
MTGAMGQIVAYVPNGLSLTLPQEIKTIYAFKHRNFLNIVTLKLHGIFTGFFLFSITPLAQLPTTKA